MNRMLRWWSFFLVLLLIIGVNSFAAEITFMTHGISGSTYLDKNGVLRGYEHAGKRAFTLELVRTMMARLNQPQTFKEVPFKRGYVTVQTEPDYALFNISRTEERENTVQWVGPIVDEVTYLYELKESATPVTTIDDARKADGICVRIGTADYDKLVSDNFENVHQNNSAAACFKMLALGRVDLVSSDIYSLNSKLKEAGIDRGMIRQTPVVVHKSQGYIAFSKNISQDVIKEWQRVLDSLKESGEYDRLVEKYLIQK